MHSQGFSELSKVCSSQKVFYLSQTFFRDLKQSLPYPPRVISIASYELKIMNVNGGYTYYVKCRNIDVARILRCISNQLCKSHT